MSHARARQAIETKLAAWAAARPIRVAYSNQPFTPNSSETYLRAYQLHQPSAALTKRVVHHRANRHVFELHTWLFLMASSTIC